MRRALSVVALAWAVVLAGCGGQLAPNTDKGVRIGFVPKSLNQEYWVNTAHGARAGGKAAHAKVLTQAGQSDTQTSTSRSTSSRTCSRRRWTRS
jgi:ABC-type sugar transport system substrate-binding protein